MKQQRLNLTIGKSLGIRKAARLMLDLVVVLKNEVGLEEFDQVDAQLMDLADALDQAARKIRDRYETLIFNSN